MSLIIKNLPEVFKNLPEVFKNLPEVFKSLPEVFKNLPEVLVQQIIEFARGENYPFMYVYCNKKKMFINKVKPYFMRETLEYKLNNILADYNRNSRKDITHYYTICPPKIESYRWVITSKRGNYVFGTNYLEVHYKYVDMIRDLVPLSMQTVVIVIGESILVSRV